ncbi:hypothetical protein [Streptomyces vinaceus]|uniref:hypothetical protein n=1 Tax=Streptomyces vinaceus TaxID=1960 RepID=UPI00382A0CEE
MEEGLELRAVVGLDDLDAERQALEDVDEELDGGLLVAPRVDPQDPQPGSVVDGGELVVLRPAPPFGEGPGHRRCIRSLLREADRFDELDVDLDAVAGQLLLVTGAALVVLCLALGGRQPVQPEPIDAACSTG